MVRWHRTMRTSVLALKYPNTPTQRDIIFAVDVLLTRYLLIPEESQSRAMVLKSFPRKWFCESISWHFASLEILKSYRPQLKVLTCKMVLYVNMLGSLMMNRVAGEHDAALAIIEEGRWFPLLEPEVTKQVTKPNGFLGGVGG